MDPAVPTTLIIREDIFVKVLVPSSLSLGVSTILVAFHIPLVARSFTEERLPDRTSAANRLIGTTLWGVVRADTLSPSLFSKEVIDKVLVALPPIINIMAPQPARPCPPQQRVPPP
ncbi:hypothetical protein Pcinc_010552 [Petrolisthes cinctipes]|uniref:Uncharacterized protein n=1 Tax=Petrolisthes cinctipes TaxID=88211 RepID=A0AAE1G2H6_PETCI|nr:hypothetical protein Pcinc_010552 [Petrolisthes cinctipes]